MSRFRSSGSQFVFTLQHKYTLVAYVTYIVTHKDTTGFGNRESCHTDYGSQHGKKFKLPEAHVVERPGSVVESGPRSRFTELQLSK